MADRTKRTPSVPRRFSPPEFNPAIKANGVFVFFLEPLILIAYLIAINCCLFKASLKIAYLRVKCGYLRVRVFQAVNCQGHPFANNFRYSRIYQCFAKLFKPSHDNSSCALTNDRDNGGRGEELDFRTDSAEPSRSSHCSRDFVAETDPATRDEPQDITAITKQQAL